MQRVIVVYRGRVQGVGFRATVGHLARGYEVTGLVRNLPDGRVELIAEGAKGELQAFLDGIAASGLSGHISTRSETWSQAQGGLRGFAIG